jgi:hypothetical protein
MKKKLFTNYTFEFDKNERKVLTSFCKQALKQMEGDEKYFSEVNVFKAILEKLVSSQEQIKFTKVERTKLVLQLTENIKYIESKMRKSWFIKKWFFKAMYNQYNNLFEKHFSN